MKKLLLTFCLCSIAAMTLNANAELLLAQNEKFGNSYDAEMSQPTQLDKYFYNEDNMLIRQFTWQISAASGVSKIGYIYYYNVEDGKLVNYCYDQYRPAYEGTAKDPWVYGKDSTYYYYDEKGRLSETSFQSRKLTYEYDDNDNLLVETEWYHVWDQAAGAYSPEWSVLKSFTYSDFIEGTVDKPRHCRASGAFESNHYYEIYTYDDKNNRISSEKYDIEDNPQEKYTYEWDENGICVTSLKYQYEEGAWVEYIRTKRYPQDKAFTYKKVEEKLVDGGWSPTGTAYIETYRHFDGATAPSNLAVESIVDERTPLAVKITANAPATPVENAKYMIWRDYENIATVDAVDGKIEYVDLTATIGEHDYFVQSYDAVNDAAWNTSDIVAYNVKLDLAPVTNVFYISKREGTYTDPQVGTYETTYVTLGWDAPVCAYPVLKYRVFDNVGALPIAEVSGDLLTVEISFPDMTSSKIRVDAVYEYGVITGNYIEVVFAETTMALVKEDLYGDHMGSTADVTSHYYYIYDADNLLSRSVQVSYQTDNVTLTPSYMYYYNNEDGKVQEYYYKQCNFMGVWSDPKQQTFYTYDAQGRLIVEENVGWVRRIEYTYDDNGNLIRSEERGKSYGQDEYDKVYNVYVYSDFVEGAVNLPQSVVYEGMYASSNYTETRTYDAQGRLVKRESVYTESGDPNERYEYVYEDATNLLIEYTKSNAQGNGFEYAVRETRENIGNNEYIFRSYNYKDGVWQDAGRSRKEYYSQLYADAAPRNFEAKLSETKANTVILTCDEPAMPVNNATYIIWRGWQAVDTIAAVDGKIQFTDSNIQNGVYEYIVQSYDQADGKAYNATAPITVDVVTVLPDVENLHFVKQELGEYTNTEIHMTFPVYWMHFAWDAPQTNMEILEYRVYQDGYAVPNSVTTNTNDSVMIFKEEDADIAEQQLSTSVKVTVAYALGESDGVTQVFELQPDAVEVIKKLNAYVADGYLYLGEPATIEIYNAAGMLVRNVKEQKRVNLSTLPKGAYIARIKCSEATEVLKFAL